jgi:hypothetical protein
MDADFSEPGGSDTAQLATFSGKKCATRARASPRHGRPPRDLGGPRAPRHRPAGRGPRTRRTRRSWRSRRGGDSSSTRRSPPPDPRPPPRRPGGSRRTRTRYPRASAVASRRSRCGPRSPAIDAGDGRGVAAPAMGCATTKPGTCTSRADLARGGYVGRPATTRHDMVRRLAAGLREFQA